MKELYELKEKLCDELKDYGKKEMSAGSLDVVDKLSHAIKNIDKIIESYEEGEYSGRYYGDGNYAMASDRRQADGRRMSRRGDMSMRSYARRNSRDGYSYHDDMVEELRELMEEAPNEKTRQEFQRFIQKIESM